MVGGADHQRVLNQLVVGQRLPLAYALVNTRAVARKQAMSWRLGGAGRAGGRR